MPCYAFGNIFMIEITVNVASRGNTGRFNRVNGWAGWRFSAFDVLDLDAAAR
jgi:hypothetical protein